jgi:hypothetical protein
MHFVQPEQPVMKVLFQVVEQLSFTLVRDLILYKEKTLIRTLVLELLKMLAKFLARPFAKMLDLKVQSLLINFWKKTTERKDLMHKKEST